MNRAPAPDGGPIAFGTVAARSYRSFARVLAGSLARHHPEIPLFVLATDGPAEPDGDRSRSLALEDLGLADLESWRFRYSRRQLAVAMKAFLLAHLLDRGYAAAIFLDADLWALSPLDPLLEAARRHALVLTPHRLRPASGPGGGAAELAILRAGAFNLGTIAVGEGAPARRFLVWWQARLARHCRLEVARGLHHDQAWLDLAPGFVEDCHLLRDPGINVGYWNLDERAVEEDRGELRAGGAPCRLFHFSGFDPETPERLTRHAGGVAPAAVSALCARYSRALLAAGWKEDQQTAYGWSRFANGVRIPDEARRLYLELGERARDFGDPFATGSAGSFFAWLAGEPDGERPPGNGPGVSRLWREIWRRREDLRAVFPEPGGRDRAAFLAWIRSSGAREHDVDEALLPAPP
ncbi:MAG: hypothetical protein U0X73_12430 [Thermoanaerobaculia bacterium]